VPVTFPEDRPGDGPVAGAVITVTVIVEASEAAQVVGAVWPAVGLPVLVRQRRRPEPRRSDGR